MAELSPPPECTEDRFMKSLILIVEVGNGKAMKSSFESKLGWVLAIFQGRWQDFCQKEEDVDDKDFSKCPYISKTLLRYVYYPFQKDEPYGFFFNFICIIPKLLRKLKF